MFKDVSNLEVVVSFLIIAVGSFVVGLGLLYLGKISDRRNK